MVNIKQAVDDLEANVLGEVQGIFDSAIKDIPE